MDLSQIDSEAVIAELGGTTQVATLCEVSPQAVSQWFGIDPGTGLKRHIPKPRLMFLRAVRPKVFAKLEAAHSASASTGGLA